MERSKESRDTVDGNNYPWMFMELQMRKLVPPLAPPVGPVDPPSPPNKLKALPPNPPAPPPPPKLPKSKQD